MYIINNLHQCRHTHKFGPYIITKQRTSNAKVQSVMYSHFIFVPGDVLDCGDDEKEFFLLVGRTLGASWWRYGLLSQTYGSSGAAGATWAASVGQSQSVNYLQLTG